MASGDSDVARWLMLTAGEATVFDFVLESGTSLLARLDVAPSRLSSHLSRQRFVDLVLISGETVILATSAIRCVRPVTTHSEEL